MFNMLVSALIKIWVVWHLAATPAWGILGAAWGSVLDIALAAGLNMFFLYRYTGFAISPVMLARVFAAGALMAALVWGGHTLLTGFGMRHLATLSSIMLGGVLYIIFLPLFGCVRLDELSKIPYLGNCLQKISKRSEKP
jgi:stage V sporulation protein B